MSNNAAMLRTRAKSLAGPKRGDALFEGNSYPRTWGDYIGQEDAVSYLRASCMSAKARGVRLDHTLIATGEHGIGKSALARLIANEMDAGLVEVQGAIDEKEAARLLLGMSDGDILFYDEFHQAVSKGRSKAEWLLPLLQDGVLITSAGVQAVPDITIIAATTDIQKVQETIISRFTIKPALETYTDEQALVIAKNTALRVWDGLTVSHPSVSNCAAIAEAGNNNPRAINQLLRTLRDSAISGGATYRSLAEGWTLDQMFKWSGLTTDGLDKLAQRYLLTLMLQSGGKPMGEKSLATALGEPTSPRHTEKLLIHKGFVQVGPTGRELTPEGMTRAVELADAL